MDSSKLVGFHCEIEIFFREAAFIMGGESEGDFVPADVDVGVVRGTLGQAGNGVYKFDGGCKIPKLKSPIDGGALFGPFGQKAKGGFGLSSRVLCHIQVMP